LIWIESRPATAASQFGVGLGWCFCYVAATAQFIDLTEVRERGRLVGFNDLAAGIVGAFAALLGGVVLSDLGVTGLAIGATALVLVPAFVLLMRGRPPRPLAQGGVPGASPSREPTR
jgi:MFS family permease